MDKIDFKKELKTFYNVPKGKMAVIDVPVMNYLKIDGEGDPNTENGRFQQAVATLYPVAYALKFMVKKGALQTDYGVMPLEGIWSAHDIEHINMKDKSDWIWTAMIMQPDLVTAEMVEQAIKQTAAKKNLPLLDELRFESCKDGLCAQILHLGPYAEEKPTIDRLHQYIVENGYRKRNKFHREIYLSDMRKTAPEKLKTIIRQPIEKL